MRRSAERPPAVRPRRARRAPPGGARRPRRRRRPGPGSRTSGGWPIAGVARSRSASWYARSRATPPKPKPLAGRPRESPSVRGAELAAERRVLVAVEAERDLGRVELQGLQPGRREVLGPVELDDGAGRRVDEVHGQQQVGARGVEHREVAAEPGVDRREHLQRGRDRRHQSRVAARLGDALEPHVALLAEPVERRALERDAVGGGGRGEAGPGVVGGHRADPSPRVAP